MEAKHKKGPWSVKENFDNMINEGKPGRHTIRSSDGWNIARVWENVGDGTSTANARLIAAAPELLGALKEARSVLETASRYFPKSIQNTDRFNLLNVLANSVNPVIAKAEGRE